MMAQYSDRSIESQPSPYVNKLSTRADDDLIKALMLALSLFRSYQYRSI